MNQRSALFLTLGLMAPLLTFIVWYTRSPSKTSAEESADTAQNTASTADLDSASASDVQEIKKPEEKSEISDFPLADN